MSSFAALLRRNADRFGARPALIDGPLTLSHTALLQRAAVVAAALGGAESRALVLLPSGHDLIVAHYGAMVAGKVAMLAEPGLGPQRLAHLARTFRPQVLLTHAPLATPETLALFPELKGVLFLPTASGAGRDEHATLSWEGGGTALTVSEATDEVRLVLCTTGTTGEPKYVSLSERNLLAAAGNINAFMRIDSSAVEVSPLPMHRSFGLGRARCVLAAGGTMILSPPRGDRALALLRQHSANGFSSVPAFFRMLIGTFGKRLSGYFAGLDYIEIGSAPMSTDDKLALVDLAPRARICMHYGLTEASRSTFIELRTERDRLETVGRPTPNVEIRVVGDDGSDCPPGESGEIAVRGAHVSAGYWGDPALTARQHRGGWFYTNDRGHWAGDGYLRYEGRADDLINVGGLKVAPEPIEEVARTAPGVADCAVIGEDDPQGVYGQVPVLYAVPGDPSVSEESILAHCRLHLGTAERPHRVRFVEAIPRTDLGKIQRARLRAESNR